MVAVKEGNQMVGGYFWDFFSIIRFQPDLLFFFLQ